MSRYTSDPKTVEYDWQEHLKSCAECRKSKNQKHYDRVKDLAEKYPLRCADCGKDVEEGARHCYHVNEQTGIMCRSTRLYFYAHQPKPK